MSLFDSINETNRAYCLHHVKRSMFLYKSMNYTLKNELYGFFYGSYGFLWILFTILTGVVHSGLAGMLSRLKWYGHVSRREDEYVGKRVMGMEVPGKRRRGRPKRRWLDSIRNDLSESGLSEEDAQDRPRWRRLTKHIDPT